MKALDWFIDRLKERSTWIGLTALLSALGIALSPEQAEAIAIGGVAVAGVIAAFTKDKTPE